MRSRLYYGQNGSLSQGVNSRTNLGEKQNLLSRRRYNNFDKILQNSEEIAEKNNFKRKIKNQFWRSVIDEQMNRF